MLLEKIEFKPNNITTIDSHTQMFAITKNCGNNYSNNESPVEEGITLLRELLPDTEFISSVTDVSDSHARHYHTPDKRWCSKRRRAVRTSRPRITEDGAVAGDTDSMTLRFEEISVLDDADLSLENPWVNEQALIDRITPQKVKHQRLKKNRDEL